MAWGMQLIFVLYVQKRPTKIQMIMLICSAISCECTMLNSSRLHSEFSSSFFFSCNLIVLENTTMTGENKTVCSDVVFVNAWPEENLL